MKKKLLSVLVGLCLASPLLLAQTTPKPAPATSPPTALEAAQDQGVAGSEVSALTEALFLQLLVSEITTQEGEPAAGFTLMLDAARKTNDAQLYQRATDIALQSRSGDAALQAAQAWRQAQPGSREANRYVLQLLIALNRISQTSEPIKTGVALTPAAERSIVMSAIPAAYARVTDKKLASAVVEEALVSYLLDPATAGSAWTTVGRMRMAAGDAAGALDAAQKGQALDPSYEGPVLLALELIDPKLPAAEVMVKKYYSGSVNVQPEMRMAYARALLDAMRYGEASAQMLTVTREKPDFANAWLVLGSLEFQDNQLAKSQASLQRFVDLNASSAKTPQPGVDQEAGRGLIQAYLLLAQIAEKRKDFSAAEAWLNKIDNADDMVQAQSRRASLLASQGKLEEGRALIRALPERNPGDARLKLLAEIALLRDLKKYQLAFDLLGQALIKSPNDADLVYDQAMLAEKLGQLPEMERLIKRVIEIKPDYHSAYNALGYSLAERNLRLPEAKAMIQKALEFVPNDPFIQDSLGWVEFRLGNLNEAIKIFTIAFKAKPDAEIAAHFGEVLWTIGQRDKALAIWREGQLLNPDNETLLETIKRLKVKL